MKELLKVGVIGLGKRGRSLLNNCILPHKDVQVAALCDLYEDRCLESAQHVKETAGNEPFVTEDYRKLLKLPEIDVVVITAAWESHVNLACEAMRAGKYVGMEVAGAYSLDDCWKLVRTHEETGTHCMLMENCCFGRTELMILNMVHKGVFGEIVHCEGAYRHDLREEVAFGRENRHYRFRNYLNRNCENYPTHELGPIANIMNINRGNRMLTLTSTASKAAGLHDYLLRKKGEEYDGSRLEFMQGDIVTTTIKCARGETITLTLDTTLPHAYSRGLRVQGTRAQYLEDNHSIFLDNGEDLNFEASWRDKWGNADSFHEDYDHPIWKRYIEEGIQGGHDGMDWLEFKMLFEAAHEGKPAPIDVYDTAAWMSITALSEQSIALGGMPVAIPDFTNGKWLSWEPNVFFD